MHQNVYGAPPSVQPPCQPPFDLSSMSNGRSRTEYGDYMLRTDRQIQSTGSNRRYIGGKPTGRRNHYSALPFSVKLALTRRYPSWACPLKCMPIENKYPPLTEGCICVLLGKSAQAAREINTSSTRLVAAASSPLSTAATSRVNRSSAAS